MLVKVVSVYDTECIKKRYRWGAPRERCDSRSSLIEKKEQRLVMLPMGRLRFLMASSTKNMLQLLRSGRSQEPMKRTAKKAREGDDEFVEKEEEEQVAPMAKKSKGWYLASP